MSECVKVIVRCRPLNDKEDTDVVVTVDPPHRQVTLTQKGKNSFVYLCNFLLNKLNLTATLCVWMGG